ncbi:hypothetical protein AX14_004613, partial [Amanita brunnescens Koide BX004]
MPTQSSTDEIDAFAKRTVRLTSVPTDTGHVARSTDAPSPSSNLPQLSIPVFSRPDAPVISAPTDDIPTAVPSRAPSCADSVHSAASTGDAGIANLLQPEFFPVPSDPPPLSEVVGRIHHCFPLASLKVDEEDPRHFLARDNTRADEIASDVDHLLSANTSWPSLFFFIRDAFKFETIKGPATDFQVFIRGLADTWSDAADFDARDFVNNMFDAHRYFPKAKKEINRLEEVSTRYRNERKAARAQLTTTEAELSRLRQAANDTLDSNARLLAEIDQLRSTDAVAIARERDEAQQGLNKARTALNNVITHSKSAMAKQVSRYQHLSSIAESRVTCLQELEKEAKEKDTYILTTEKEHAAIYREREAAECNIRDLRKQLDDTTVLFETAHEGRTNDHKDFEERAAAFKKHIAELNARINLLPSGKAELRSLVVDANERAGIAEEEYRKKSAALKSALKEIATLKATKTTAPKPITTDTKTPSKPEKTVRWGFEPSDDTPASQPFWDHSNEYSKYIASMVAATVTAIPNMPMQMAISTAIETVHAAGPSILSQSSKPSAPTSKPPKPVGRPPSPSLTKPAAQSRPRSPAPTTAKGPKAATAATLPASATFAQIAASVLAPSPDVPVHPAKSRPTWRAVETNKSLVLRPGTKGTRVSELHIRVPKVAATAHMFSLSGTKLINEVLRLVNESHNRDGIKALKENHLVLVKWSMRGNLIIKCSKPMDDTIKDCLHDAIKAAVPPSSTDSISILNKPPTTALKYMTVPRHNEDGSETDSFDLYNDLIAHDLWRGVELFSQPCFLPMKENAAGGTVIVSVVDDNQGTIGRKLMNTVVSFSGASRHCLQWVEKEAQLF